MGIRGGKRESGWKGHGVVEQVVPHSHAVDKNWEGYLGSQQSQLQARLHNLGFQCQEDKASQLLAVKTSGGWTGGRNC